MIIRRSERQFLTTQPKNFHQLSEILIEVWKQSKTIFQKKYTWKWSCVLVKCGFDNPAEFFFSKSHKTFISESGNEFHFQKNYIMLKFSFGPLDTLSAVSISRWKILARIPILFCSKSQTDSKIYLLFQIGKLYSKLLLWASKMHSWQPCRRLWAQNPIIFRWKSING